ncbi:hypothetical protein [Crocosphaera chwakensis]|uniref:Uncharacterized protein n=1 Tax=Crocosphaera chwakensis CCY0110 TaxID=391612 RepID=A3ITD6_9CHRO|nr:hypothetical protein [Crocosphaera chwakensis]EAZ90221.1 hypothetical protein CY0110_04398 [Crocosphaera chwakensis CCY0110]
MNLQKLLKLDRFQQNKSEKAYKESVVETVEALVRVGITPDDSCSLSESVERVLSELTDKETELYGQIPTKEEIEAEIKKTDKEIEGLEQEKSEIERKIAMIRSKRNLESK